MNDKVRRTKEEVNDITVRIKARGNRLSGNKHPLLVGVSYMPGECSSSKRGKDCFSLTT